MLPYDMSLCRAGLHDLDVDGAKRSVHVGGGRYSTVCRECNNEKARRNGANYRAKRWATIVEMYGGKCACPGCEQTRPVFLSLDHVNDDGAEHRRQLGGRTHTAPALTDAMRTHQPDRYQLLCHNCNATKGRHSCQEQ